MRYVVLSFPFELSKIITTDFRLIAICIACIRRLLYPAVCVYDSDRDEFVFFSRAHKKLITQPSHSSG